MAEANSEVELLRRDLKEQLQKLSWGLGVWEPNLVQRLPTELKDVRHALEIDLSRGHEEVHLSVEQKLQDLVGLVKPPSGTRGLTVAQREEQFRDIIRTSFNLNQSEHQRAMGLTARRRTLADKKLGDFAVSESTAQRELNAAIDQMVEYIIHRRKSLAESAPMNADSTTSTVIQVETIALHRDERPTLASRLHGQNESDSAERPIRRPWIWRRRPVLTSVAGLVCLALAVGVPVALSQRGSAAANNLSPPGDFLLSTVNAISSLQGGLGIVYATDQTARAKSVAAELAKINAVPKGDKAGTGVYEKDYDIAIREVKEGGAYLLRGMQIAVEVEGLADSEITINDVVVKPVLRPVPLGTAIVLYNSGGGDKPRIMKFNMDSDKPVARQDVAGTQPGPPFFDVERIGLPKGHKETLVMLFRPTSVASEFDISIKYEVKGEKYTENVDFGGHHFRIAPIACPIKQDEIASASEDARKVAKKLYESVYDFGRSSEFRPMRSPQEFSELPCNF